jgi:hypothetical protein
MTRLRHDRYCNEVVAQTALLSDVIYGAGLSAQVQTCPGWTLAHLVRRIGGNLRSVESADWTGEPVDDPMRQVPGRQASILLADG